MKTIKFTVDSALLRELGERLVGRAHIALAELVKNSYDADATRVVIRFGRDEIEVADNGHGMEFDEFERFWMRIGTPHKQSERFSRYLKRPMSGSKGVGRLAVQFLGRELRMETVSRKRSATPLSARVNWDEAIHAGDLTHAQARYEESTPKAPFPGRSRCGTRIVVSGLKQEWGAEDFKDLAREIWWLQPPFRSNPEVRGDQHENFEVTLKSPNEEQVREFQAQMRAYLDIWHARLVGKLVGENEVRETNIALSLEFSDGERAKQSYSVQGTPLRLLEFEIRIYHLKHRQAHGIKVGEARNYLNEFGGVHVYDGGFHLPYYGPDTDWLRIEIDHSHRLSASQLLPEGLQVAGGMTFLPTQSRILGVVHVSTARERASRETGDEDYLKIQVTRDRLVDNRSFESLRKAVRWALDFYAMQEAKRSIAAAEASRPVEAPQEGVAHIEKALTLFRNEIPERAYKRLEAEIQQAARAVDAEERLGRARVGLLGALATAGISAVAYQHEVYKQFNLLRDIVHALKAIDVPNQPVRARLAEAVDRLEEWLDRARHTRALFSPLMEEENRSKRERLSARFVVEQVAEQTRVLLRGIKVETSKIEGGIRLPPGTFAEWSAIFQNVILNAANALLDAKEKRISVSSRSQGLNRELLVQDTGSGVDLAEAEELFEPFVRKLKVSQARRALGLGGTGLGLTIVKMLAEVLGCRVAFVKPTDGFKTAFQVSWRESR
jgi:signal transduction histidine kinase